MYAKPANKNKRKKGNRFNEKFRKIWSSQNARNGVSEHQDFANFLRKMFSDPPSDSLLRRSRDSSPSVIKIYPDFTYPKGPTVYLSALDTYF